MPRVPARTVDQLRSELMAELWEYETTLCALGSRVAFLEGIAQTVQCATRGKNFTIRNDVAWWTLRDAHDMVVVHLASFVRGLTDRGGLFTKIRGKWMPVLKRPPVWRGNDEFEQQEHQKETARILAVRFSQVVDRREIRTEHVEACVHGALVGLAEVVLDRDRNRAHRYEHEDTGTSRVLSTTEIRQHVLVLQQLLLDLRYLSDASNFDYPTSTTFADANHTAEELVDQMLLGTRGERDGIEKRLLQHANDLHWEWQRRKRVYDLLHDRHASHPNETFNGDAAIHAP